MKKYSVLICTIVLIITACNSIQTPIVSPVTTSTSAGFQTQAPVTSTITTLPTIPTFTPTFDISKVVTVTPADKEECLKENPDLIPIFKIPSGNDRVFAGADKEILDFLNQGGSLQAAALRLNRNGNPKVQDITNDNVPELIFAGFGAITTLNIFTCKNHTYHLISPENILINEESYYSLEFTIEDMNKNGIPEVITIKRGGSGNGTYSIDILEWDGENFQNLSPRISQGGLEKVEIEKPKTDQPFELRLTTGKIWDCCYPGQFPLRGFTNIYKWNGQVFALVRREYDKPEFRFQAVEDGDAETITGNYSGAFNLYEEMITNSELDWWSRERADFTNDYFRTVQSSYTTPPPMESNEDAIIYEYNSLAAYAYYRIMLLQLVQEQTTEATATYQTLQETFGKDHHGYTYAVMATTFWDAYQLNHKMYDGCAAAIEYAVEHPEILIPLGSDYHGAQSQSYVPADACPFR